MSKNVFKDIGFSDEKAQLLELKSFIFYPHHSVG